jgi:hypothetical protein
MSRVVVAAIVVAACGEERNGAARLNASLESIGKEMTALHEPRRSIEYHDRSAKPFWVAFIPAHTDGQALIGYGITSDQQCPASDNTTVAVGRAGSVDCVTLANGFKSDLRAVHKDAGAAVQITIYLDVNGYRIADLK